MRLLLSSLISLLLYITPVNALDVLIYHSNYSDTYTNVKAQMEADGHTVTGSTSTTVASNLIDSYDVVVDLLYNNNCGSTCRGNYDDFVEAGGKLIITGENESNFSSRNANIESLISNKFGGTLTIGNASGTVDTFNSTYTDNTASYTLAGGGSLTGDGEWVAKVGSTVVWMTWQGDDLPSGYTGAVYVTADVNQFQSQYGGSASKALYSDLVAYGGGSLTYTSSISTSQQTSVNTLRSVTHSGNGIYINQVGSNNTLNVTQDGNDNLIAGGTSTTNTIVKSDITGSNNTTTMTQRGDNNAILFDITGDYNSTTVDQGGAAGSDDNRIEFNVNGDHNVLSLTQQHNNGVGTNGHYLGLDVDGNYNNVLTGQKDDGDKKAFISVQGNSNDIDLLQQGSGSHYVEIEVGSNQTVDVTQDGTGNHNASISMDGYAAGLDLTQDSSTNQTYSLDQTCLNANGCGTTTLLQQ